MAESEDKQMQPKENPLGTEPVGKRLLIFPRIWGIDGILYVGPVADAMAVTVALILIVWEFHDLRRKEREMAASEP